MFPYFENIYGNPSSIHSFGLESKLAVDESRKRVSSIISAKPQEIIFTSGGTESDNLAVKGIAYLNKEKRKKDGYHIISDRRDKCVFHYPVLSFDISCIC